MIVRLLILKLVLVVIAPDVIWASAYSQRLYNDIFTGYNPYLRPVTNENKVMNVTVRFIPRGISEFNEVTGQISVALGLDVRWNDDYLKWNPRKYGNITSLVVPDHLTWKPKISLSNPTDKMIFPDEQFTVRIYFNGRVMWLFGGTVKTTCRPNVKYFPFDVQPCHVDIFSMDFIFREMLLIPELKSNIMDNYGEWDVYNQTVFSELLDVFSTAVFHFHLRRRPEFSLLSICIPILFLGLLNACVFLIPPASGERISYAITVLLSIAVFMTIVSNTMPKNSDPVPILSYILMAMLCESGVIVLLTIFGLCLYFKSEEVPIPNYLRSLLMTYYQCCSRNEYRKMMTRTANVSQFSDQNGSSNYDTVTRADDKPKVVRWQNVSDVYDTLAFWFSFALFVLSVLIYGLLVNDTTND